MRIAVFGATGGGGRLLTAHVSAARTALGRNVRCGLRLSRADLTDLLLRCAVSAPGQVVAAAY